MKQNDFSLFFNPDFSKTMTAFPLDMQTFWENQQKNFQALTEAQQITWESLQAVSQRQSDLLSQIVANQSALTEAILSESSPEEKVAKQADLMKKNYEESMKNFKEISDLLGKSSQKAGDVINKRVSASLTEMKSTIDKGQKTPAKKAA